ncbi:MAG: YjbH domain-containing protein, partial [Methylocystaceae bacterium]|nr:YjbH domain-containing protein [Methylocystaceae bacterium]
MPIPRGGLRAALKTTVARRLSAGMCLLAIGAQPAVPQEDPWARPTLNYMGVPGLLDMPSAHPARDADLGLTLSLVGGTRRGTMHFQIAPRLSGVFRYSRVESFDVSGSDFYDRSFDIRYLLAEEGRYTPAVSVGLQDFGGTGVYAAEYLVATKTFGRLRATGGIGWGRFGSYNGFTNPLGVFAEGMKTRPSFAIDAAEAGSFDADSWFRGDAALFGGLQYVASDRLLLTAEYSSDAYAQESSRAGFEHNSPLNFGASYRLQDNLDLSAAWLYGSTFAVNLTYTFNPKTPNDYPGGLDQAPRAVQVRAPG